MLAAARNIFEIFGEGAPPSPLDVINAANDKKEKENKNAIITYLPVEMLMPYHEHLFKPYPEDKLRELAEDIKENGILSPVSVRPCQDAYEILAGHNRTNAAKLAGLPEVPCIIMDCDDDTAALIVVNSNLNQRENLLPSEKAKAYKTQLELFNKRGKSVEILRLLSDNSQENQEDSQFGNKTTVYRFIRLTYLTDGLLQAVDDGTLALVAGEELSYIERNEQECIYQYFFVDRKGVLDIKFAKLLRQRAATVRLTCAEIDKLFQRAAKPDSIKACSVPMKKIREYIPAGTSKKDVEIKLINALKYCTENHIDI